MMDDVRNFYNEYLANSTYDDEQLKQICLGLESLLLDEVKIYCHEEYSAGQMTEIRLGLETLPVSLVMEYVDSKKSRELMAYTRIEAQRKYFKKIIGYNSDYYYDFQIVQVLRAIKTLPIEMALSIADFNISPLELEQNRKKLEKQFLIQMVSKNDSNDFSSFFEYAEELKEVQKKLCKVKNN